MVSSKNARGKKTKAIDEARIIERRGKGRFKRTWEDDIKNNLKKEEAKNWIGRNGKIFARTKLQLNQQCFYFLYVH